MHLWHLGVLINTFFLFGVNFYPDVGTYLGKQLYFLRKLQHTPGRYPRPESQAVYEGNPFICCISGYLGYVLGVCWKFLRYLENSI